LSFTTSHIAEHIDRNFLDKLAIVLGFAVVDATLHIFRPFFQQDDMSSFEPDVFDVPFQNSRVEKRYGGLYYGTRREVTKIKAALYTIRSIYANPRRILAPNKPERASVA